MECCSDMYSEVFVSGFEWNVSAKPLLCLGQSVEAEKLFWDRLNLEGMLSLSRESAFRATWEFAAPLPLVLHSPGKSGVLTFDYGWPWSEGTEICVHRLLVPKVVDQEGEDSDQDWTWKKLCLQGGKHISRILAEVMGNSTADLCDFSGVELLPRSTKNLKCFQ